MHLNFLQWKKLFGKFELKLESSKASLCNLKNITVKNYKPESKWQKIQSKVQ